MPDMQSLEERVRLAKSGAGLNPDDRLALVAINLLTLAGEMLGMVSVSPEQSVMFKERNGYVGEKFKVIHEGEQEVVSLSVMSQSDEGERLFYVATVLVRDNPDGPLVVVRGMAYLPELEGMYRELRYGKLLSEQAALPPKHLVAFEEMSVAGLTQAPQNMPLEWWL